MSRFTSQTIVVTGASRGLGRAMASAFAAEGGYVYVGFCAREDEAAQTLARLRAAGGDGALLGLDVRQSASVAAAFARVQKERGRLDVLVNNAGVARDGLFALMPAADFHEVVATNLTGSYHCAAAAARLMLAEKRGVIINIASAAGLRASVGQTNYAASKGGLLAFTRSLAAELGPRGVRVNAVVPGLIAAGMGTRLDHRIVAQRQAAIPLGRLGSAEEVARAVLFLASDESSYILGQCLAVDGGLTL
jgi:3-oxoacyl-[acyl-carrier protein] reductase